MCALNLPLSPEKRKCWRVPILSCRAQATWTARERRAPFHPPGVSDSIELDNDIEVTRQASENPKGSRHAPPTSGCEPGTVANVKGGVQTTPMQGMGTGMTAMV